MSFLSKSAPAIHTVARVAAAEVGAAPWGAVKDAADVYSSVQGRPLTAAEAANGSFKRHVSPGSYESSYFRVLPDSVYDDLLQHGDLYPSLKADFAIKTAEGELNGSSPQIKSFIAALNNQIKAHGQVIHCPELPPLPYIRESEAATKYAEITEAEHKTFEEHTKENYTGIVVTLTICIPIALYVYLHETSDDPHHDYYQPPFSFLDKKTKSYSQWWPGRACQMFEMNCFSRVYKEADILLKEKAEN